MQAYIDEASAYIRGSNDMTASERKLTQHRLSNQLGAMIQQDLAERMPNSNPVAGEQMVAGGLRRVQVDIAEVDPVDGLRLACEIKPCHLALRSLWNRFGDLVQFATNVHLRSPYAICGAIVTVPRYEIQPDNSWVDKTPLITRLIGKLGADRRTSPQQPPHLTEATFLLVFDPRTGSRTGVVPLSLGYERFLDDIEQQMEIRSTL